VSDCALKASFFLLNSRIMLQAYIRALERQERNHQSQQEETLAIGITNAKVIESFLLAKMSYLPHSFRLSRV
jgi:hypothetical protein